MGTDRSLTMDTYESFLKLTRVKVNKMLNKVLWICIVSGPALALGVRLGIFPRFQYETCVLVAVVMAVLASVHMLLTQKLPDSKLSSFFALASLDFLLVFMADSHINIALTYFIVPLVALLFCDKKIYLWSCGFNFLVMHASVWNVSKYYAGLTVMHETPLQWYLNKVGGYTIETVVMVAVGYVVCNYITVYFLNFYRSREELLAKDAKIMEQFAILSSMTEIYQCIELLDLERQTSASFGHKVAKSNEELSRQVMVDHSASFLRFTDLTTLRERLGAKKIVSAEFISTVQGWFRAQYIVLERNSDGLPTKAVYTIQNIDEDKKREEHLIRISNTDELTRVFNRRSYENDILQYREGPVDPDLVLVSADVNGLKKVNDTLGHEAGDEIIMAAANCLVSTMGHIGKVYRVGGDEFMVVARLKGGAFEEVVAAFQEHVDKWSGRLVDRLSVSVGYVCKKDYPEADIDTLERTVDSLMYKTKKDFYRDGNSDRRA